MSREHAIIKTSLIGVAANVVLVGFKMLVGLLSGSIAIILDAVNNLTDVLSSIVTIIGAKLAARRPDAGHPYGHGRIEYIATLVVGLIIFSTGLMALTESIPKIIHPELADYSLATIVVIVSAIFVKLFLGLYVKKSGQRLESSSLIASGVDALFDAVLSFATLIGIIITLVFQISIDGILGALIALLILKTSLEILREASNDILGCAADRELTQRLREFICSFDQVSGAYDLMLHSYGPSGLFGSVEIQIPDQLTASEIHRLTFTIAHQALELFHVRLTIGICADNSHESHHREIREFLERLISERTDVRELHGLYIDDQEKVIHFDLISLSSFSTQASVESEISSALTAKFPDYQVSILFDLDPDFKSSNPKKLKGNDYSRQKPKSNFDISNSRKPDLEAANSSIQDTK